MILHIPHSSIKFPNKDGFLINERELNKEVLKLTDWYTDKLFETEDCEIIKADFSRIFCDTERFSDNQKEVMYQFGMGALYEKSDNGKPIRKVSKELRKYVLENYYWKHHNKFTKAVSVDLKKDNKCLIIDCHSFPNIPLIRDLDQSLSRPHFNIGTDVYHTPKKLITKSIEFFEKKGYTLGVDEPYSGSIVPMDYYRKDKRVKSIMLEINRDLYLEKGTSKKLKKFNEIRLIVQEYISLLNGIY